MYSTKAIPILLLAFFGCFSSPVDAQINLKSGYNFSIPSTDGLNEVIRSWNQKQNYTSSFRELKWLHGFEAGIRFRTGVHALELTYQGAYKLLKAEGTANNEAFTDKIKIAVHSGAIGYQVANGLLGAGVDLQYQFYKDKFEAGLTNAVFKDVQKMTALKTYLMFTLQGGQGIDMAIQPYFILPFNEFDSQPLADYLQVDTSQDKEKWIRFGLTVLFYNGEK